jgi:hypothetical protein
VLDAEAVVSASSRDDSQFNQCLPTIIDTLKIEGATKGTAVKPTIQWSRTKPKQAKPMLPFAPDHRKAQEQMQCLRGKARF